jgi:acid stress-induced BolA-like protein IbaG/YrbA
MTADQLKAIISAGLACEILEVEGDGSHWYATIVSTAFDGQRPLQRQRLVFASLCDRIQTNEVHALSMKTFSPAEWAKQA